MEIFQVGGSVRDELMGIQPKDRDWVVINSSPEEMEKNGVVGPQQGSKPRKVLI